MLEQLSGPGKVDCEAPLFGVLEVHLVALELLHRSPCVLSGLKVHKAQDERLLCGLVLLRDDPDVLEPLVVPKDVRDLPLGDVAWEPFHVECGQLVPVDPKELLADLAFASLFVVPKVC